MTQRDVLVGGTQRIRPIERLRGMDDWLPPAACQLRTLIERLSTLVESYGYELVDGPLLEPTELFLRKAGESLAPKLYAFDFRNRNICLRPEFTASIGRLFVEHLQDAPLPQRLYYSGPVLRHEKPQRGRRRQYPQFGLEMIGGVGAIADAEIILTAWHGLAAAGLDNCEVVLGHIGATLDLLGHLQLDRRARDFLLSNLENLARTDRGVNYVEERLRDLYASEGEPGDAAGCMVPRGVNNEDARALLSSLLERLDVEVAMGSRTSEEIIDNVLDRLGRPDQVPLIRHALGLIQRLNELSGRPDEALPAARVLLQDYKLDQEPLKELTRIVDLLQQAGLPRERIKVNLGFGRGLQYYTGMIFEVYPAGSDATDPPLCGGGRYDDLVMALGGRKPVPACGFAFSLHRILSCMDSSGRLQCVEVLLVPGEPAAEGAALALAQLLRTSGLRVEVEVRARGNRAKAQYAAKLGIPYILTVTQTGEELAVDVWERASGRHTPLRQAEFAGWAAGIVAQKGGPATQDADHESMHGAGVG